MNPVTTVELVVASNTHGSIRVVPYIGGKAMELPQVHSQALVGLEVFSAMLTLVLCPLLCPRAMRALRRQCYGEASLSKDGAD